MKKKGLQALLVIICSAALASDISDEGVVNEDPVPFMSEVMSSTQCVAEFIGKDKTIPTNYQEMSQYVSQNKEALQSGSCWYAHIKNPDKFAFKFAKKIRLPKVGIKGEGTYTITQTFHNDSKTHEEWHAKIFEAFVKKVWDPFESYVKGYQTPLFRTKDKALQTLDSDFSKAFAELQKFQRSYGTDKHVGHPGDGSSAYTKENEKINGVNTPVYKAVNPDWGSQALEAVQAYAPNYQTTKTGDCEGSPP